jgi:uncharacterized protein (UPF0335 family)
MTKKTLPDDDIDNDPMFAQNEAEKKRAHNSRLKLLMERIDRLEEEKKGISDDIRDVYAEGKAVGYDPKIMRRLRALMKMKPDDRNEMETILDLYKAEVGL